ncbi:unnamed protein product [Anisakis simplex]|uniref:Adenylate kinase isoenzyme 5 (inferred by orthology to a human protein) n=1 Tax=Anisakis simplex TaxID=6269 RepID=A0A0M3K0Y6_ANISI|nr:unnamed protein product [Anisakis simplex]
MGAEAKRYLEDHSIPQLFESLMTGLIYNKPENPIDFLANALSKIREQPDIEPAWDMFIESDVIAKNDTPRREVKSSSSKANKRPSVTSSSSRQTNRESQQNGTKSRTESRNSEQMRPASVMEAADLARIPDVPIILFMGGPGGGKTRHAERVRVALSDQGLVHICMPDMIRNAITKYKERYPEWKEAALRYQKGELIPNNLALALVKAEMGKHPDAKAFFLEGFPREARQVEDFEREVRPVNMALILDYDEATLRRHMQNRGLDADMIDARIREFKQKTLPSAKYFDDQRLLHLIPGEKDDQTIYERMKMLVQRAMDTGIPVLNSSSSSQQNTPQPPQSSSQSNAPSVIAAAAATVAVVAQEAEQQHNQLKNQNHNNVSSRPPTRSSRPQTQASRTSRPPSLPPSRQSTKSSTTTQVAQPNGSAKSQTRTPTSKAPSVPATPPKTAASQRERESAKSLQPESKQTEQPNAIDLPDKAAVGAAVTSTFELESNSNQENVTETDTVLLASTPARDEAAEPISSTPVEANELHDSSPIVQNATVEDVDESSRTPETAMNVQPKDSQTVQKSQAETKGTPAEKSSKPNTPERSDNQSKASAKSNRSSIKSATSIKSVKSNTSKKTVTEDKGETPESTTMSPKPTNAIEVPVEVHSPPPQNDVNEGGDEEEEKKSEENKEQGEKSQPPDSKISSTASTPGPAGSTAAQLAEVAVHDTESAAVTQLPRGLPNNAPVVLVIGAPGSNKAAIAHRIAKKYDGFVSLSMGELLRRQVRQNPDDELWQRIGKKMNAGETVPMKICRDLLYSCIHDVGGRSWGYVIEGYPRTQAQAIDFENQFERLDLAILVDCTEQYCMDNIKKRLEAAKDHNDARAGEYVDTLGYDKPDAVKVRLAMFKMNTLPMLKYFDDKGKLRVVRFKTKRVDGDLDVDKIFVDVASAIDNTIFIGDQESGKSLTSSKEESVDGAERKEQ